MSKRMRTVFLSAAATVALVASFVAGCTPVRNTSSPSSGIGIADEAWNIINNDYVDRSKVDATKLSRGAVSGMVDALNDPYTTYLSPEEYKLTLTQQQGSFGGIGATVGVRGSQVIVIAPIPGTPAATAGIRAGDAILAVNGKSVAGMSVEEVVTLIRGPAGTKVKVTVQHEGDATPIELEITRATIDVPSVVSEMRGDIAHMTIRFFSERTDQELTPILQGLKPANATGIILDLRSNPGGLVDAVVDVASHFIDSGVVLYIVDNSGKETTYPVRKTAVTTSLPLVVLTDNFSASGSEVLSGALQDHKRATIAGTVTFGKGSADRWFTLSDGSALYLTTSRWLTPNRRLIEGKGITPDVPSTLKGDDLVQWAVDYLKAKQTH